MGDARQLRQALQRIGLGQHGGFGAAIDMLDMHGPASQDLERIHQLQARPPGAQAPLQAAVDIPWARAQHVKLSPRAEPTMRTRQARLSSSQSTTVS